MVIFFSKKTLKIHQNLKNPKWLDYVRKRMKFFVFYSLRPSECFYNILFKLWVSEWFEIKEQMQLLLFILLYITFKNIVELVQ